MFQFLFWILEDTEICWCLRNLLIFMVLIVLFICVSVLFQSMLCLDPTKRITARSAVEHEYFKDIKFVPWFYIFTAKVFIAICAEYMDFDYARNVCYLCYLLQWLWDPVIFQFFVLTNISDSTREWSSYCILPFFVQPSLHLLSSLDEQIRSTLLQDVQTLFFFS